MKKILNNALIAIGTVVVAFGAYSLVPDVEKPPLDAEFSQMALHQYAYYNELGSVPTGIDHLPGSCGGGGRRGRRGERHRSLRSLVGAGTSGITWDAAAQTLVYEYSEPVAMRRSTLSRLSFGLFKTKANISGRSITPDTIIQNTPIYEAEGLLVLNDHEQTNKKQNETVGKPPERCREISSPIEQLLTA